VSSTRLDIERGLGGAVGVLGAGRLDGLLFRTFLPVPGVFLPESTLVSSALSAWPGRVATMCALSGRPSSVHVADDVEDLVAHELVVEAQGLLRDDLVALDDDRAVERAALDLAESSAAPRCPRRW
jgi:hypothetical protein